MVKKMKNKTDNRCHTE